MSDWIPCSWALDVDDLQVGDLLVSPDGRERAVTHIWPESVECSLPRGTYLVSKDFLRADLKCGWKIRRPEPKQEPVKCQGCGKSYPARSQPRRKNMHGLGLICEDGNNKYYRSEHGIKVVPHSGEWSGYYRLGKGGPIWQLYLIAYCEGKAPPILQASITAYENLARLFAVLPWEYDGDGKWEASSAIHDDGCNFTYRIGVCEDGTFSVSESDIELIGQQRETFDSLDNAKNWCNNAERNSLQAAKE